MHVGYLGRQREIPAIPTSIHLGGIELKIRIPLSRQRITLSKTMLGQSQPQVDAVFIFL